MSIIRKIKDNRLIRGTYFLLSDYFGWKKSKFGYIGENVIITPPSQRLNEISIYTIM